MVLASRSAVVELMLLARLTMSSAFFSSIAMVSQMATYLFVMGEFGYSNAQKSEVKTVAKDVVKSEV